MVWGQAWGRHVRPRDEGETMAGDILAEGPPATAIRFPDHGGIPNNRLPLLHYASVLTPDDASAEAMEALLEEGGWPPRWRASVFTYHHYHSTCHEVLGVAQGEAELHMGGPDGEILTVAAGDVIVIPAGVGHKRVSESGGFMVVGGYPPGQEVDLLRGEPGERPQADSNIANVPMPETDPVFGMNGPLFSLWTLHE